MGTDEAFSIHKGGVLEHCNLSGEGMHTIPPVAKQLVTSMPLSFARKN